MRHIVPTLAIAVLFTACAEAPAEPPGAFNGVYQVHEQGITDCTPRQDTGYTSGQPFAITVVTIDSKPVERDTGNAFWVMKQAAAADGVNIQIVSGFRTHSQQQYLYGCYTNCNCNNCNLAAVPGYSNHQSGHALDLNTSSPGVLNWLNAHGAHYGFSRTVPSEPWHWEWWGGGPGGGVCAACEASCNGSQITNEFCETGDCGAFGLTCADDSLGTRCVWEACPATGTATVCFDDATIANCNDGLPTFGDCSAFAAICSQPAGMEAACRSAFCVSAQDEVPIPRTGCFLNGEVYSCDAQGAITVDNCPAGQKCTVYPDVHCSPDVPCPATGEVDVCATETLIGKCYNGGMYEATDCAAQGSVCNDDGSGPTCVAEVCVQPGQPLAAHDVCLADGSIGHCDDAGQVTVETCPEDKFCTDGVKGLACADVDPCQDGGPGCVDPLPDDPTVENPTDDPTLDPGNPDGNLGNTPSMDGPTAGDDAPRQRHVDGGCNTTPTRSPAAPGLLLFVAVGLLVLRRRRCPSSMHVSSCSASAQPLGSCAPGWTARGR